MRWGAKRNAQNKIIHKAVKVITKTHTIVLIISCNNIIIIIIIIIYEA